ncbi:MAG: hypothetical protein AB7U85_04830 [Alphaproteobacteria bacterium]
MLDSTSSLNLTGILGDIADVAGAGAALTIADLKGGTMAYIPQPDNLKMDHWLVKAVGLEKAKEIAKILGGGEVEVPLGPLAGNRGKVRKAIKKSLKEGLSTAQTAKLVGVHCRTVYRHKSDNNNYDFDDDQFGLFE